MCNFRKNMFKDFSTMEDVKLIGNLKKIYILVWHDICRD